jgi:hypothetical protein
MQALKTLVLVHGFHLHAEAWEDVVWGDPQGGVFGRASRGILEALACDATAIMFGTGTSEKDAVKEGDYTYRYAREHIGDLEQFAGKTADELRVWLASRAYLELRSQDTREEIEAALRYAQETGMQQLILVSSPTHIMRCQQLALSLLSNNQDARGLRQHLYAVSSDVPYAGTTVDDVCIIEPPHRPDRPNVRFDQTAKRLAPFFKTMHADIAEGFNAAWALLVEEWKKKL